MTIEEQNSQRTVQHLGIFQRVCLLVATAVRHRHESSDAHGQAV